MNKKRAGGGGRESTQDPEATSWERAKHGETNDGRERVRARVIERERERKRREKKKREKSE